MDKNTFWEIIEACRDEDTDIILENLVDTLTEYGMDDVVHFGQFLGLYTEHGESPATYAACKLINKHASDDTLLYFCLWLIAQGREAYFGTLENPDYLADWPVGEYAQFEMLMSVPWEIMQEDLTQEYGLSEEEIADVIADIPVLEWTESEEALIDELPLRAPKLFAKYGAPE